MSARYSRERDVDELEQMVERLGDYLLGDAMYLPIGGGSFRGSRHTTNDNRRPAAQAASAQPSPRQAETRRQPPS